MKLKEKILIISIIIFSILGITQKTLAGQSDHEYYHTGDGKAEYFDGEDPAWVGAAAEGTHGTSGTGVLTEDAGKTKDGAERADNGEDEVGSEGGGGAAGESGHWIGGPLIDTNFAEEYIYSKNNPSIDTKETKTGEKNVFWYDLDLCPNLRVTCTRRGWGLTGSTKYVTDRVAKGYWTHEVYYELKLDEYADVVDVTSTDNVPNSYGELEQTGITVKPGITNIIETFNVTDSLGIMNAVRRGTLSNTVYDYEFKTPCEYGSNIIDCVSDSSNGAGKAFVLSEVERIKDSYSEKTPLQVAWWRLFNFTATENDDGLYDEAMNFQTYITDPEIKGTESKEKVIEDTVFKGFPIEYKPTFVADDNLTTVFSEETQKWTIGPFKIDYYEYENYAGICGIHIFVKDNQNNVRELDNLKENRKYELARKTGGNSQNLILEKLKEEDYPKEIDGELKGFYKIHDNEEFYIILDYDETYTDIYDLKVDFMYQNAGGKYQKYEGSYNTVHVFGNLYGEYPTEQYKALHNAKWNLIKPLLDAGYAAVFTPSTDASEGEGNGRVAYIPESGESNSELADRILRDAMRAKKAGNIYQNLSFYIVHPVTSYFYNEDYSYMFLKGTDGKDYFISNYSSKAFFSSFKEEYAKDEDGNETDEVIGWYTDYRGDKKTVYLESTYNKAKEYLAQVEADLAGDYYEYVTLPDPMEMYVWEDLDWETVSVSNAQIQSVTRGAARWWEYTSINYNPTTRHFGVLEIKKEVTDEDVAEGDIFEIVVQTNQNGNITTETLQIPYVAGGMNTVKTSTKSWGELESAPTYEIKEVKKYRKDIHGNNTEESYDLASISNASGSYEDGNIAIIGKPVAVEGSKEGTVNGSNINNPESTVTNVPEKVNGKIGIIKIIKSTGFNTDQYSLLDKDYTVKVTIQAKDGNCKISYNGSQWQIPEGKSQVLMVKVKGVLDTASQAEKEAAAAFIDAEWNQDGEAPIYNVEEADLPIGSQEVKITENSIGNFGKDKLIQIYVINTPTPEKAKLGVVKTITEESKKRFSQEELKKFEFKFFVNVYSDPACTKIALDEAGKPYEQKEIIATLKDLNDLKWIGETKDEYAWAYGNNPYFKIVEDENWCIYHHDNCTDKDCPYKNVLSFNSTETQNSNRDKGLTVEGNGLKGRMNSENIVSGKFDCSFVNSNTTQEQALITIEKTVDDQNDEIKNLLKDQTFEFIVKVSGTFFYRGTLFENKTIQLTDTSEGYVLLENEEDHNNENTIKISMNNNDYAYWPQGDKDKYLITWYGEAPKYSVEENLQGKSVTTSDGVNHEIFASGLPKDGTLDEKEKDGTGIHNITVKAENHAEDGDGGYIKVIKKLVLTDGREVTSDLVSQELINRLRFKFNFVIKNKDTEVDSFERILGRDDCVYHEDTKTWTWEYTSPRYDWAKGEQLTYTVTEDTSYLNSDLVDFLNIEAKEGVSGNSFSGVIPDAGKIDPNDFAIEVNGTITNVLIESSGNLRIQKEITKETPNLDLTKFKFKVTINGKFSIGSTDYNGEYVFYVGGDSENRLTRNGNVATWDTSALGGIHWYGTPPTYTVEEVENQNCTLKNSQNTTGTLNRDNVVTAVFVNEPNQVPKDYGGTIKIRKELTLNGQSGTLPNEVAKQNAENAEFRFNVTVNNNGVETKQEITVKAGDEWVSDRYVWKEGENPPTYTVEEIGGTEGFIFDHLEVDGKQVAKAEGELKDGTSVDIVAVNKMQINQGRFRITKNVIYNKLIDKATSQNFKMTVVVTGTFAEEVGSWGSVSSAEKLNDNTYKLTLTLGDKDVYTSPTIKWYGNEEPVFTVEEERVEGWERPEYSNNGDKRVHLLPEVNGSLNVVDVVVTNKIGVMIELTMDLGGTVWEDDVRPGAGKNNSDSTENGIINEEWEKGIDGVEVYVYRVLMNGGSEIRRTLADEANNIGHGDVYNFGISYPIITSGGGKWKAEGLNVTGLSESEKSSGATSVKYDVKFVYDGQTYEPTSVLSYVSGAGVNGENSYSSGGVDDYVNSAPTDRLNKYGNSSMADDINRAEVDNRIQEIYGKTPIDGSGNTLGTVNGITGERDVFYESDSTNEDTLIKGRRISKLQTTDKYGVAYDLFKTEATTSQVGLQFPVDNAYKLDIVGTQITVDGYTQIYKATYEHCLHINLGLKKRKEVDVEATKDLYSAKVVVDGKELDYKFNKLSDMIAKNGSGEYNRVSDYSQMNQVQYELGLYKTDYFYRAELYRTNSELYDSVVKYYHSFDSRLPSDSELEVYLTYRIDVTNNSSPIYDVIIDSLDDYSSTSLGTPISTSIIKIVNGERKLVADKSYLSSNPDYSLEEASSGHGVTWNLAERNINSSDGSTYNKFNASNLSIRLRSGESRYIYVTYAIQKDTIDNIDSTIILGNKSNIVEIAKYSSNYAGTDNSAGKIDRDSAPANVNIRSYNDENLFYEDDSDAAPVLNLTLVNNDRKVSGIAWEDKDDGENEGIRQLDEGNTKDKDKNEARIGGLTTQLVEKIKIPVTDTDANGITTTTDIEYDFLWPTSERLDYLGGKTLEELTGFDSTTETSRVKVEGKVLDKDGKEVDGIITQVGQYDFSGIPTGDYVVRFVYGNDKTELPDEDAYDLTPAQALDSEGKSYSDNPEIYTANYDGDIVGMTAAVYNGQDYKSTIYQKGFTEVDGEGNVTNSYHDLGNGSLADAKVSDARDSEYRRLEVIANSETITNTNSNVLASANDLSKDHKDLYGDYAMFADTAKINLDIEGNLGGVRTVESVEKPIENGVLTYTAVNTTYYVENIDFGLIERPENNVVLDKEIKEIKITTSDQKVIFDALYNINYTEKDEHEVNVNNPTQVVITKLQDESGHDSGKYLVAEVTLDTENSVGIDQLQALNKNEIKPVNAKYSGTQNFRFINVDTEILQGTTIEIDYQIAAINVGEIDYTGKDLSEINDPTTINTPEEFIQKTDRSEIRRSILGLADIARDNSSKDIIKLGSTLGSYYYTGNVAANDKVVKSKVRQIVDYVDNDAMFDDALNEENDHIWRNTSINELTGNGYTNDRLVDVSVIPEYEVLDKHQVLYKTDQRNNLVLSTDDQTPSDENIKSNANFEKELIPYIADTTSNKEEYISRINLTVTKTVSAQDDADNLSYDNLTEIVKIENSVGRRDMAIITGNANPEGGEFPQSLKERDASATELITFTPPTGIDTKGVIKTQVIIVIICALSIVSLGIVAIKKLVIRKTFFK